MGIRHLNRYLRTNCSQSIRCVNLADLSGKRIAVDISIYLYKYEADNALLENIYLMLAIFRHHNIIPIFIFDGKPPPEKKALLIKRKEDREQAQEEYNQLKIKLKDNECDDDKQDIVAAMDQLKKQIVQLNKEKIETVKKLIIAYGATYYDAVGEADELCAALVLKKKVWACLSEDMDLFVYGCSRVLRYFSLVGHTAVLYYMKGILEDLSMTHQEFKEICVLSGTDYNIQSDSNDKYKLTLQSTMKYFRKFKQEKGQEFKGTFYKWLETNTNYITDIDLLYKINEMFDIDNKSQNIEIRDIKIVNGPKDQELIESIMSEEDFIFIKHI